MFDLPRVKPFPDNSVQCDDCGGNGQWMNKDCEVCNGKGWLTPKEHPKGRVCHRMDCWNPIPPNQVAVYCSNECAWKDA